MKDILHQLLQGLPLTAVQAESTFSHIMSGQADPNQTASFLTLLASRQPTVDELVGAATVMRRHVLAIPVAPELRDAVIDTAGTGGVGSRLFNVSTTAAIVVAACGVPVAKHGNRSFTSRSGSSDVLRLLGVNIEASPIQAGRCLAEAGICFAFAPLHHPAMRHVGPIRAALGFTTIFNILGPLTNPAGARRQLIGVRSPQLADTVLEVLVRLGVKRAMLVTGYDSNENPLCELSTSARTHVAAFDGGQTRTYTLEAGTMGLPISPSNLLEINTAAESATVVLNILSGQTGAPRDIVLLNAAAALWIAGKTTDLAAGIPLAQAAIDSGAAKTTLEKLAACSYLS